MCCIVDVHHTRGLVILFLQKYKENKEIPKDFWKKMSDGTVMADGIDHHLLAKQLSIRHHHWSMAQRLSASDILGFVEDAHHREVIVGLCSIAVLLYFSLEHFYHLLG